MIPGFEMQSRTDGVIVRDSSPGEGLSYQLGPSFEMRSRRDSVIVAQVKDSLISSIPGFEMQSRRDGVIVAQDDVLGTHRASEESRKGRLKAARQATRESYLSPGGGILQMKLAASS